MSGSGGSGASGPHEPLERVGPSGSPASRSTNAMLELRVRAVLGGLNLDIDWETRARSVAIVGPSGAGKSTLLRVLAGLEPRARGVVRFQGEVWQDDDSGVRPRPPWTRGVGWAPQNSLLLPHLTVSQNLVYGALAAASSVKEVAGMLAIEGLLDRRPRNLSGGERQRVALGRALLSRPRLLLLDEPLSALDRGLRDEVAGRIGRFVRDRNVPLVLVSHDREDVQTMVEEQWTLSEGRVGRGDR